MSETFHSFQTGDDVFVERGVMSYLAWCLVLCAMVGEVVAETTVAPTASRAASWFVRFYSPAQSTVGESDARGPECG